MNQLTSQRQIHPRPASAQDDGCRGGTAKKTARIVWAVITRGDGIDGKTVRCSARPEISVDGRSRQMALTSRCDTICNSSRRCEPVHIDDEAGRLGCPKDSARRQKHGGSTMLTNVARRTGFLLLLVLAACGAVLIAKQQLAPDLHVGWESDGLKISFHPEERRNNTWFESEPSTPVKTTQRGSMAPLAATMPRSRWKLVNVTQVTETLRNGLRQPARCCCSIWTST